MKRALLSICLVVLLLCVPKSHAVSVIFGTAGECNLSFSGCTTIPLTPTLLCGPSASCPIMLAPSFVSASRFWGNTGSGCKTSTDGAQTWANCTTAPLSSGAMEHISSAADGSVIVAGSVGVTCTIVKSTDNGVTWNTVYSNVAVNGCGGAVSGSNRLICLSDDRCTFLFMNSTSGLPAALESTDDGDTWALSTVGVAGNVPRSMAWDGTSGIMTSNTLRGLTYTGGVWAQGTAGIAGCTFITGSVVYNSSGYGLCYASVENYEMHDANGALFKTITLPGALLTGGASYAQSIATNVLYVAANSYVASGNVPVGIWVSRDNGVSFVKIYTTPIGTNSSSTTGSAFFANGCVYFSVGTTAAIVKIC